MRAEWERRMDKWSRKEQENTIEKQYEWVTRQNQGNRFLEALVTQQLLTSELWVAVGWPEHSSRPHNDSGKMQNPHRCYVLS